MANRWDSAKALYDQGQYELAIKAFQEEATYNAPFFYNLGNSYFRLGEPGIALAYYEKANRLKPRDTAIQHNVQVARKKIVGELGIHADGASNQLERWSDRIPLEEALGVLSLATFLLALLWLRTYWKSRSLRVTFVHPSGWLGVFTLLLTFSVYLVQRLGKLHPPAYSIQAVLVRSGPGDEYLELARIRPGMKVRIVGSQIARSAADKEQWQQVRFGANQNGWVPSQSLLPL